MPVFSRPSEVLRIGRLFDENVENTCSVFPVDVCFKVDIDNFSLCSCVPSRFLYLFVLACMDITTLHNMHIVHSRLLRSPVLRMGCLRYVLSLGSFGDADATFSQAMGGSTVLSMINFQKITMQQDDAFRALSVDTPTQAAPVSWEYCVSPRKVFPHRNRKATESYKTKMRPTRV